MTVNADDYISSFGAGSRGAGNDPLVWWGYESRTGGSRPATDRPGFQRQTGTGGSRPASDRPGFTTTKPTYEESSNEEAARPLTKSQALLEFYSWTPAERAKWGRHLLSLGLVDEDESQDYYALEEWWKQVVDDTANLTMAGKRLTPFQVARLIAGGDEGVRRRRERAAEGEEAPFSGTKTQTSTSIDITDPKTAKALVNSVLAEALGRAANPEELAAFTATLNSAERANPLRTTSTGTYRDGELVSRSDTTTGGLTGQARSQILMDEAMKKPEYGAYQAATYYMNALAQAIQSPV